MEKTPKQSARGNILESGGKLLEALETCLSDEKTLHEIEIVAEELLTTFRNGGKLLLAGNGGSAAEAQHMAAEYVNKLSRERRPLPALALSVDTSVITSISNDRSFSDVFARQVEALGVPGDMLFCYSTSGSSANIRGALEMGTRLGLKTVLFTGTRGAESSDQSGYKIVVPSNNTQRIQELHLLIGHSIADWVETQLLTHE